jgi:hypothetical protein
MSRPVMVVSDSDLAEATLTLRMHLVAQNEPPTLFQYGDVPVRVERHPDTGRLLTRALTVDRLLYHLAESIEFVRNTKSGERPTAPPVAWARNLLAAPEIGLPQLTRLVDTPVFGCHGQLVDYPGYCLSTGILYQPPEDVTFDEIPAQPTETDVGKARQLLCDELLGEFPFVGASERAHAVAALLQPFVRELIDGPTPLFLIEKPSAGTGGSLLADVLLRPALGRALPAMTAGRDLDEWRKRLTAILGESPVACLFDNLDSVESAPLATVLTASEWKDRPLGVTGVVHLPVRCLWIATANNPRVTHELMRRTVRIRLDAGTDRPWLRDGWRHPDLVGWATAQRTALVGAALTLVQNWIVHGQPLGTHPTLGSFERWSAVMGGILDAAGIPGFLGNLTTFYEEVGDDDSKVWHALMAAWWMRYGEQPVGVRDIWELTQGPHGVELDLGDKGDRSQRTRLGKLLGRMRDRVFDDHRVTAASPLNGSARWRLRPAVVTASVALPAVDEMHHSEEVPEWA